MGLRVLPNAILICLSAAICSPGSGAADEPKSGWAKFGRAIAERTPDADQRVYESHLRERLEADAAIAELQGMQADHAVRNHLIQLWQKVGLSLAEANAMARAYRFDPGWEAMLMSVRRTGVSAAAPDMWKAYDDRDFNRANLLLLSIAVVMAEQPPPQQTVDPTILKAVEDIEAQSKRWEASDPRFAQKMRILKPRLQSLMDRFPPDQWASQFEKAYLELNVDSDSADSPASEHSAQE